MSSPPSPRNTRENTAAPIRMTNTMALICIVERITSCTSTSVTPIHAEEAHKAMPYTTRPPQQDVGHVDRRIASKPAGVSSRVEPVGRRMFARMSIPTIDIERGDIDRCAGAASLPSSRKPGAREDQRSHGAHGRRFRRALPVPAEDRAEDGEDQHDGRHQSAAKRVRHHTLAPVDPRSSSSAGIGRRRFRRPQPGDADLVENVKARPA